LSRSTRTRSTSGTSSRLSSPATSWVPCMGRSGTRMDLAMVK
jgi:hypothetical protein